MPGSSVSAESGVWERGLAGHPWGVPRARGPARGGQATARTQVLSGNSTKRNHLLRSHFKSIIVLHTELFFRVHPEYNLSQTE